MKKDANSLSKNDNIIYDSESSELTREESVRNDNNDSLNDEDIDAIENEVNNENNNAENKEEVNETFFFFYENTVNNKTMKNLDVNDLFDASEIDSNVDINDENDNDDENDENESCNILSSEYV